MLETRTAYYLRNARTKRILDGPYLTRVAAEHEAHVRNLRLKRLQQRRPAGSVSDLIEVVPADREGLAA